MEELINKIPIGKENAIHQTTLASLMGVSPEVVKRMVREARQSGFEILSGKQGYWLAKDDAERAACIRMFSMSAISHLKTARTIKSPLNNLDGQISLFDGFINASEEAITHE